MNSGAVISAAERESLSWIIRRAGEQLLAYWPGNPAADKELGRPEEKSDGSFVSRADYASNEVLLSGLGELFPHDRIHSEERFCSGELPAGARLWIVDPLDGTGMFLQGRDDFSILVALTRDGRSEFGVMYFPARGLYLEAVREQGATLNGQPVAVSSSLRIRAAKVYTRLAKLDRSELQYPAHLDSGVAFLQLMTGELDGVVFRLEKLREWDLAAPSLILEEAGGKATNLAGEPLCYLPGRLSSHFIGSNGRCHTELLAAAQAGAA